MRVLVCGGRNFEDNKLLKRTLNAINRLSPINLIIQGKARGADTMAKNWAKANKIKVRGFKANWDKYGKAAGPIRNKKMIDKGKPDMVVAFPGGIGTHNMVKKAEKAGIFIFRMWDNYHLSGIKL